MPVTRTRPRRPPPVQAAARRSSLLNAIAVFKLVKALLLVALAVGLIRLLGHDRGHLVGHWVRALRVDPDNLYIHRAISHLFSVSPAKLKALSAGSLLYAALFFTEGIGLLMGKRWAEYFTIIATATLIPVEAYELVRHPSFAKLAVLLANLLIVLFLCWRVRRSSPVRR